MNKIPYSLQIEKEDCTYTYTVDEFNKRLRVDDYYGNVSSVVGHVSEQCQRYDFEKLIFKARSEDFQNMLANSFIVEAKVDRYFYGSDMYFFSKYYDDNRRKSDYWIEEDALIQQVLSSTRKKQTTVLTSDFHMDVCTTQDTEDLAHLYDQVFKVYPVPMNDPAYVEKSMNDGNVFLAYRYEGRIVSAVCGEINHFYHNAEITDCATLPGYRQFGLVQRLLKELEQELQKRKIFCLYTIARARSYGMNAAFHRLDYAYRGRMANNCLIYEDIEDMNIWVKNI